MNTKQKSVRHGDVCLIPIKEIPKDLKPSSEKVLLEGGSGGHPHTFTVGAFYPKREGENVIGYFKATAKTELGHVEHGNPKIPAGFYEVRRQIEVFPDGMKKQVVD